jgi:uncharacterized membrane protein YtjA (UPF0391 family)
MPMLYYSLVFHIVRRIASALGLAGLAALSGHVAWLLFVSGVVLLVTDTARQRLSGREAHA